MVKSGQRFRQDLCVVSVVSALVARVEKAIGFVIRRATGLIVRRQEILILLK